MLVQKYKKLIQRFVGNIIRPRFGWKKKLTKIIKFFYFLLGFIIEIVGDVLFFWKNHHKTIKISSSPKILIVKIDQFGDVLFSTFLVPLIKQQYPDACIDYLVHPKTEVLLQKNPHIRKIFHWDEVGLHFVLGREKNSHKKGILSALRETFHTIALLRCEKYDVIVNTRAYIPSTNIWWKFAHPKNLVSFDIAEHSFLTDVCVSYDLYAEEWKNYLKLLVPLGIHVNHADFAPEFYNYSETEIPQRAFVVIAPVSFDVERQWEKEKWVFLMTYLQKRGYEIILSGIPSHETYLRNLCETMGTDGVSIKTNLSIPQLAYCMRKSELVIGIDSFPMHLGLAVGKHIVCVVNELAYYVPQLSRKAWWIDARCMIPHISYTHIFSVHDSVSDVVVSLEKLEFLR